MTEFEVVLEYVKARTNAAIVGLELTAKAEGFVLRDVTRNSMEFARCATLPEVAEAVSHRAEMLRAG